MSTINRRLLVLLLPVALTPRPAAAAPQAPLPPGNILAPGAQILPAGPQPRVVPFAPQSVAPAAPGLQLGALQQRLVAVRGAQALSQWQRRQMVALMREQVELSVLQQELALWRQQALNPADQQQMASLDSLLASLQQQNLLQQLAIMQP